MRFLVQAVNGVGVHSLDAAEGDGNPSPTGVDTASIELRAGDVSPQSPYGVSAVVTNGPVGLPNRTVKFTVSRGGTGALLVLRPDGRERVGTLGLDGQPGVPSGVLTITADVLGDGGAVRDTATLVLDSTTVSRGERPRHAELAARCEGRRHRPQRPARGGRSVRFVVTRGAVGALPAHRHD